MALQNGTEIKDNVASVTYYDLMQANSSGELITKYKAIGTTHGEIGHVYKLKDDGTHDKSYTQASSATSGSFAYDTSSRKITFDSTDKPNVGEYFECAYTFTPTKSQSFDIVDGAIPSVAIVTAYGVARDICSGKLFTMAIEGQAQIDGNWSFDNSADGDPAVQNLNMEFVKGCLQSKLYNITIFDEEDMATE